MDRSCLMEPRAKEPSFDTDESRALWPFVEGFVARPPHWTALRVPVLDALFRTPQRTITHLQSSLCKLLIKADVDGPPPSMGVCEVQCGELLDLFCCEPTQDDCGRSWWCLLPQSISWQLYWHGWSVLYLLQTSWCAGCWGVFGIGTAISGIYWPFAQQQHPGSAQRYTCTLRGSYPQPGYA